MIQLLASTCHGTTPSIRLVLGLWVGLLSPLAADRVLAEVDLREQYRAPDGQISQTVYDRAHGLAPLPGSETFDWHIEFRASVLADEDVRQSVPLTTDVQLTRRRCYAAPRRAIPVWDGRVFRNPRGDYVVAAYGSRAEQTVGKLDQEGKIDFRASADPTLPLLQRDSVAYDPFRDRLWCAEQTDGPVVETQTFALPWPVIDAAGRSVQPRYRVEAADGVYNLIATVGQTDYEIATADVVTAGQPLRSEPGYTPKVDESCRMITDQATRTVTIPGQFNREVVDLRGEILRLKLTPPPVTESPAIAREPITIDGRFDDWRNISGLGDPRGDTPGHLQYNADTDLLEFKVAHDEKHLYFYTRVAGRHGNTAAPGKDGDEDRYYFYAYIDADADPATGYIPTRDDDCYFGVAIGDDCEAQFEFANGRFIKTFYGFAGAAGEDEVLAGIGRLGASWYSRFDGQGLERPGYKVEYIRRQGVNTITKDLQPGSSDCIVIGISPDGRECEMRAALEGFLLDPQGKLVIGPGTTIDVAVGVEASGRVHGHTRWSADSTAPIRGYRLQRFQAKSGGDVLGVK